MPGKKRECQKIFHIRDVRKIRNALLVGCFLAALLFWTGRYQTEVRKQVACIGDSITEGVEVTPDQTYPACLQNLLGNEYRVQNYGKKGRALLEASRRPYREEEVYRASREEAAEIYLIMLGSNDIWEESWDRCLFEKELEQFVHSYQEISTDSCVYLLKPPEYFPAETDARGQQMKARMQELYRGIERVAEKTDCGLIDLYMYTREHPEWFADEVHPNALGNQRIAEYIYRIMSESYETND